MSPEDVPQVTAAALERLRAAPSDHARQALSRWWVRRYDLTAAYPGSAQHAVAAAVLDTLSPNAVAAYRRAIASRDDAA